LTRSEERLPQKSPAAPGLEMPAFLERGFTPGMRLVSFLTTVMVHVFFGLLFRVRIRGSENFPRTGGLLLASNHTSFLDPPILQMVSRRFLVFTPRRSLRASRFYRWLTRFYATIPIEHSRGDAAAARHILRALEQGYPVALFPEQTRSSTGEVQAIKPGFHFLAERARVPVLPIIIRGAFEAWPRARRLPRCFRRVDVKVGRPFRVEGMSRREAVDRLRRAWSELGAKLGSTPADDPGAESLQTNREPSA